MSKIVSPFAKIKFDIAEFDGNTNYGKFVVGPLERGYALTIGNSLRRVMLSSLPGASVFAIEVEGARHEFSALEGVEEDVTMIILSLKDLVLKIDDEESVTKRIELEVEGPKVVTAADLVVPGDVEVINPDLVLAHVAEGGKLKMTLYARNGRGYVTSEGNKLLRTGMNIGTIATDSNYSPITKVNYEVQPTRVGHNANYENLVLEVWTNGSMLPQDAVALAAKILVAHFEEFLKLNEITRDINIVAEPVEQTSNKY